MICGFIVYVANERTVTTMSEKDLDTAIEMCERIMEFDTRTMQNPVSENGWIFEKVYELLKYLRQLQFATDSNVATTDTVSRAAALKELEDLNIASFYEENEHSKEVYTEVKAMLNALSPAESELENKIRAIGYTGKEGRIYIGGRLFAIRELPQ